MRIVVAEAPARIELIDCRAACLAQKELRDCASLDRVHRSIARSEDVHRLVPARAAAAPLVEVPLEGFGVHAVDRKTEAAAPELLAAGYLPRRAVRAV